MVKVEVKWQREVFRDVEVDTTVPPAVFKSQLFSLTGVPPERQKILGLKGGLLKDDADWGPTGIRDGSKLTMLGSAAAAPQAPAAAPTFLEDLPMEQQDTTGLAKYGAGLENLGNTCYMNSTLQCLYAVEELRDALADFRPSPGSGSDPDVALATATRQLFSSLTTSAQPIPPMAFLLCLRKKFPQFAQQAREGYFMQQDAEECWTNLLFSLRSALGAPAASSSGVPSPVEALFGVRLGATLRCSETGEETRQDGLAYSLKCNITGDVNQLAEGVRLGLREDRESMSPILGRLAMFEGSSEIESLPPYLCVQMVRFFYKADVQQKAKILRKVGFPTVLDTFEFCSSALQERLAGPREAARAAEDAALLGPNPAAEAHEKALEGAASRGAEAVVHVPRHGTAPSTSAAALEAAAAGGGAAPGPLTGRYELAGVLTHKGRSADSGHYVAWVKQQDGRWVLFDDDEMSVKEEAEVLALAGGGDWHMAYLLLYRAIRAPAVPEVGNAARDDDRGAGPEPMIDEPAAQA